MKRVVWKNKSNNQLCLTIPSTSEIKEGDIVEVDKSIIKTIAYSGVVGDLFHYGHLHSIKFANSLADYNIVGVLTDKAVEEYRIKPLSNLKERKAIISSLNCVDRVVVQDSRDPTENLKKLHEEFPNAKILLVHGSDLKYVHGSEYVKTIGGDIVQHPYYERLSTFKIINQIIENKDKFKDITKLSSLITGEEKFDFEYEKGNKTIISTKADTLQALKPILKKSKIEDLFVFTFSDWKNKKQDILAQIKEKFKPSEIVVRSSAVNEDTLENSMAGCFESVLNINPSDEKEVELAIKKVVNAYKEKSANSSFNQILVQTQTMDVSMSGVLFTRTLEKNSPYYVINYDDSTGTTDSVTKGIENKTIKISKFVDLSLLPKKFRRLLTSVIEIENLVPSLGLDIEFAITKNDEIIIFQVRPLTTSLGFNNNDERIKKKIEQLKEQFIDLSSRKQHLAGERTFFGDMPDWNPAEIIGDNPNHLDFSLYNYLITNSAWHEARTSQGYYNVNPAPLVVLFGNKPYVDVRSSFNSFVPSSVSQGLREKLVNFYLAKLEKNPEMQDKVEFEVVNTCYDFCFDLRAKELEENGFSQTEISELRGSLINLTNDLIIGSKDSILKDSQSVKEMEEERVRVMNESQIHTSLFDWLTNARFLLDDCKKKGTVQFSRLARLGFIGKILLKSLIKKEIISDNFYNEFMNSITTVATEINIDFNLFSNEKLSREDFIKKYYHLRPGSYDITSLRYDKNSNLLKSFSLDGRKKLTGSFLLDEETKNKIDRVLKKYGLLFTADELFLFTRKALEAREYSKFEFTKNLSEAIELIARAGEEMGFTRQELALLDVNETFVLNKDREQLTNFWKEMISWRMKERELSKKLMLPPIIFSENDFDIVKSYNPRPNYITQKKAEGKLINLSKFKDEIPEIKGQIVMIENGDPGYDWIFTRKPAGLITKYGGVASHMSIRCAEFGIPAAIGCGSLFDQLVDVEGVVLDCMAKRMTPLRGL